MSAVEPEWASQGGYLQLLQQLVSHGRDGHEHTVGEKALAAVARLVVAGTHARNNLALLVQR
eukprot:8283417-Pyramimonas_sp.AAC.1